MNRHLVAALAGFVMIFASHAAGSEKPWIELDSPHFRVITNGKINDARSVARQFEQLRYVFASQFPNFRLESGAPLLVFAARDEDSAKALEPRLWKLKGPKPAGVFHQSWEKQYVMVRLDGWSQGTQEVVYHEYVHSLLHLNSHWLPQWLDEGLAEYYAYTRFEEHEIVVGAPTERYRTLLARQPLPIENLMNGLSQYRGDENKIQMFYAESWALVHFLIFGPEMEKGKRLDHFYQMLQEGVEQKKAFQQEFGDLKNIDQALEDYTRRFALTAFKLSNPPKIEDKDFTQRALSAALSDAELAGFHLFTHDLEGARPLTDQALKDDPKLGLAHENMGFLLFAEGSDAAALDEFAQAFKLDGSLYLSLFFKSMMSPTATSGNPEAQAAFKQALLQVLGLNSQFAPAFVQFARQDIRDGDLVNALAVSRKAEQLEPSRAGYHLLSGQILLLMGKGADAAASAKFVADRWVGPDHDEAVELWNLVPSEQRPASGPLYEMLPKDTQTVSGAVKSAHCDRADSFDLTIIHDNKPLTFQRKSNFPWGFSDTIWYGGDHVSLCHHLEGMRAIVRYSPARDAGYAGDIAEIEIRDDLPAVNKRDTEKNVSPASH